jgi:hypothetical protein
MLVDPKAPTRKIVMDVQKVQMDTHTKGTLRLPLPTKKGKYKYEMHAVCDSYVGCDIIRTFEIQVKENKNRKTEEDLQKENEEIEAAEEEELRKEEEAYPPRWYYLYYTSFGELVINGIVFALLCVFIFNFLHSRGYWQDYVQPVLDTSYNVVDTYVYDLDKLWAPPEEPEDKGSEETEDKAFNKRIEEDGVDIDDDEVLDEDTTTKKDEL